MKRVAAATAVILALSMIPALAQRRSPHEEHDFTVDGAKITIAYGRPYMRGRKIFGGLVPYGVVWMPGADEATTIQTSLPLKFGGFTLPAGRYSLYTLPGESSWTLIINKKTGQYHTEYPEAQNLVKLPMTIEKLPEPVEQLTISAAPRAQGGGQLQLDWELTRLAVPFAVAR